MRRGLILILFGLSTLSGCSRTARLYPVHGPLSTQTPLPVYTAKMTGAFSSGNLTATLNNGEVYKGRWEVVPSPKAPKGQAAATDPSANSMSAAWDSVYGEGYYVAHVLGARLHARGELKGNTGTVVDIEMYRPLGKGDDGPGEIKGVAKDSNGNIFKVAF